MSEQNSVAFVATESIPPSPPPANQTGAVKWLRENLFSNWQSSLLTVVSLYLIFQILSTLLPWVLNGVWTTSSLSECREVLQG